MEQEEKGIEKKEQEEDKKNEKLPLGGEKMRKKSDQENVSIDNSSRVKVFERCSLDRNYAKKYNTKVDPCSFNKTVILDTSKECLSNPLESANR